MGFQTDFTPMIVLLSILIPLGIVGTVLGSIALVTYHVRASQITRVGGELIQKMLDRGMSAEEIERILIAWSQDPGLIKKFKQKPPLSKLAA